MKFGEMVCIAEGVLQLILYAVQRGQNNGSTFQWEIPVKRDIDLQTYFHRYTCVCNAFRWSKKERSIRQYIL